MTLPLTLTSTLYYIHNSTIYIFFIRFFNAIIFCFITEIYTRSNVAVISFPRYCRYRATLKRLEGVSDEWLRRTLVQALCGFVSYGPDTRVMFCKVSRAFTSFHFYMYIY